MHGSGVSITALLGFLPLAFRYMLLRVIPVIIAGQKNQAGITGKRTRESSPE